MLIGQNNKKSERSKHIQSIILQ